MARGRTGRGERAKAGKRGKRAKAWEAQARPGEAEAPALGRGEWFRLVPAPGPEAAVLWIEERPVRRCGKCRSVEPEPPELTVDRKLAPEWDLLDDGYGGAFLCSDRFLDALEAVEATGWSARELPHATPNEVHGWRLHWLMPEGSMGELVDTEIHRGARPERCPKCGRDSIFEPVAPVSFAAEGATGHDLCLSREWLGDSDAPWRALVVSRRVAESLLERLPAPLTLGIEPVTLAGEAPAPAGEAGAREGAGGRPPKAPAITRTLARLREEADAYGHRLYPPADPEAIEEDLGALGVAEVRPLRRLLEATNGPSLFHGALDLGQVGEGDGLMTELDEMARSEWEYPAPPDAAFCAGSTYHQILWTVDPAGRVRGAGAEGIVYGPGAPYEAWLADQVADLAYAADHRDELPWAEDVLQASEE